MKPDEDMHAAVEEVDLDPCDLYTDLGILIVEGRVPGLTDKGFGEGPHCPTPQGQNRHQCDPSSPECQKYDQILKHMLLLWKNGIPMTIEVLMYPNCCVPSQNVESVPDVSYILLEQWTIHMLPRRVPDATISPRSLLQAVRSFLYFSQLCAWFSLTGGKSPRNIHYRVCVPGEAFSSKFSSKPDVHMFPVANIGRNAALKVLIKSHPRCGEIPVVPCFKHSHPDTSAKMKYRTERQRKPKAEPPPHDGILPTSRTSSPADSMLGESLLDPPNALCMYTKRYQSPSRCGSPSIEVPEHLMFGKSSNPTKRQQECPPQRQRSRPQRRPVVERFLKKGLVDDLEESEKNVACKTVEQFLKKNLDKSELEDHQMTMYRPNLDQRTSCTAATTKVDAKQDIFAARRDVVANYCCIEDYMKDVPREEMEEVLERLCQRNAGLQCSHVHFSGDRQQNSLQKRSLSDLIDEMKIKSNILEQNSREIRKNIFYKTSDVCDSSKNRFKQALRYNKESSSKKFDRNSKSLSPLETLASLPEVQHLRTDRLRRDPTNHLLANKLLHSYHISGDSGLEEKTLRGESETYQHNVSDRTSTSSQIHPKFGSVNIKKCGAFLLKSDNCELSDEREISTSPKFQDACDDSASQINSFAIPSAEKKALFRRSLDSATSLVFHQRSGLPLTSSPAPVRKSGTCFDFDSSITSVSAIKRALFEKEPEETSDEKENTANLSNSAPASIVSSSLLGTFEESVLNGRLEPVSTVEGFTAEIGASGSFCPRHITLPVTVFFYTLQDMDKVTSPYMGHINLRDRDYHVPKKGTVQVTLFNPHRTVVKMFVVRYDLTDMPVNCQTFLRQRTLYMPSDAFENDTDAQKWLRYLIHLRFMSSKSGRIYLHTDIRVIIFRKSDLDAATVHGQRPYELRSFTHGPLNPKFSPHKP